MKEILACIAFSLISGFTVVYIQSKFCKGNKMKKPYDIGLAKIGDSIYPNFTTDKTEWVIIGFILDGDGRRVKTTIQNPTTREVLSLEFL
jgi:hypothetical protein